ncbi:hypothetical protein M3T53_02625 [Actinomyces sp. B33]|uniref:hypothetical protein n=1 Tax=Actinomyces sp. B33 TaxID=2942131 RepID=UPI0023421010|nr:hypothetical protein [Actinomyces sp. B33]MDC4232609.1 hypothetical protein [Actinomyces sp. B33]
MHLSLDDIVPLTGRHETSIARADLIRIRHGFGLRKSAIPTPLPAWGARSIATEARILATGLAHRIAPVFALESAMVIHGIPALSSPPEIRFHRPRSNRVVELPQMSLAGTSVRAVRAWSYRRPPAHPPCAVAGIEATGLIDTAVQMAVQRPFLDGFVTACAILRRLSRFDRFCVEQSREREAAVRRDLLETLDAYGPVSRGTGAGLILAHADAACESIGEQALLGVLLSLSGEKIRTQVEVHSHGRIYFLDAALPERGIAFEFDGVVKMGSDSEEFRRAQIALMARQRDLEDLGWTVIRVGWPDLKDPRALRNRLQTRIERASGRPLQIGPLERSFHARLPVV